ncbi:hypothetical protein DFH08DRAFT_875595 [Mycena albidolilacea]|uniref:Uncharacterized protein n=1 Tax=Mycena albidolilacea TaxID=1033008 RepID=A0AAD6ZU61_9AGAR|nr:hypothetical protein DFH08DRAFT_875595 [Mycena albidolilacea]
MPRRPGMKLDMSAEYTPELEYSVNLGAESGVSTPLLSPSLTALSDSSSSLPENILDDTPVASPIRTRSWRPVGVEREQKARSTAYDAAGNLKVAARARKADARDCGICEEPAVSPVKTLCCGALFCRQHIDDVRPLSRDLSPNFLSFPLRRFSFSALQLSRFHRWILGSSH